MQRSILVFGCNGQIGRELLRHARNCAVGFDHARVDICDREAVARALASCPPSAIVNAAAFTAVDDAEQHPNEAFLVNGRGPAILAEAAVKAGVPLIHLSTDYVFGGNKRSPYLEGDVMDPASVYGQSKAVGEDSVRRICAQHLIVRTSWIFSPHRPNFVHTILDLAAHQSTLKIVDDQIGCPTNAADVARTILYMIRELRDDDAWGTYHYCGADAMTRYEFARQIFGVAANYGVKEPKLLPIASSDYPTAAKRPSYSVLDAQKIRTRFGIECRPLLSSLSECLQAIFNSAPPRD